MQTLNSYFFQKGLSECGLLLHCHTPNILRMTKATPKTSILCVLKEISYHILTIFEPYLGNDDDDLQVGALTAVQEKRGPGHTRDSARMQLLKILSTDKYILIYGKDNVTCFSHYGKLQFLQKKNNEIKKTSQKTILTLI